MTFWDENVLLGLVPFWARTPW